jgi:hypothetical protein
MTCGQLQRLESEAEEPGAEEPGAEEPEAQDLEAAVFSVAKPVRSTLKTRILLDVATYTAALSQMRSRRRYFAILSLP